MRIFFNYLRYFRSSGMPFSMAFRRAMFVARKGF